MAKKTSRRKQDGRSSDLKFLWLLSTLGPEWLQWQQYAAEWMSKQDTGTSTKREALTNFFETYLLSHAPYAINVTALFKGQGGHQCSSEEFVTILKQKGIRCPIALSSQPNYCVDFIGWVISEHFSASDDNGVSIPLFINPLSNVKRNISHTETVRNPLPYRYIQDLREILCPTPEADPAIAGQQLRHFKHWEWAQQQTGQTAMGSGGDWFEVETDVIDKADPDCVWRTKEVERNHKRITIHQIWSPVSAMVLFIKLHLPLRTYQVRMLDSGEADTYRYAEGGWALNDVHGFALGSAKRPYEKGVFNRIYDSMTGGHSTGIYINSNKTSDKNKEEFDRGYSIPWENAEVLYWLEKLRNWQEKYNPIAQPTDCTTLLKKHTGEVKSQQALQTMGEISFLFRDASAKGRDKYKPVTNSKMVYLWYQFLLTLENQLFDKGIKLDNGEQLKLVIHYPEGTLASERCKTLFPIHSLRVSLITCYVMDTDLPLPVISKLLAGHTRLLMTIYYTKLTPSVMAIKMAEGELQLEDKAKQSVKGFLKDASMAQIQCKMVYHNENSISAALANRNPIGWEERSCGMCLVGGNTVKSDETSTLGGCWNGGVLIKDATNPKSRVYSPVPNGPENCVRCRWFITEAKYLSALTAHLNQVSYKQHQAQNLANELEWELEQLKDEEFLAEQDEMIFTKHDGLQQLQRRFEKQTVASNNYTEDFIATFNLIHRINQIEEQRTADDTKDKLIAVGSVDDVKQSVRFVETDSELLHLSVICEDTEFYPDLEDELRKTPAIEKRSRTLNRILMKKGFEPLFMEMDDKQQLISANAMMRHMAKIADPDNKLEGFRKVAGYLEAEEYMRDHKLLSEGLSTLTEQAISLTPLLQPKATQGLLEINE
jgi:hypothetical protein